MLGIVDECQYGRVETSDDYQSVLRLRHTAYTTSGKMPPNRTVQDMQDEYDARAIILTAKHHGAIVGSVRAIFNGEGDQLSYGRYFPEPIEGLPPRSDYVEGSRMCVLPEYRGHGLFYGLFARQVLATLCGGRRYVVGGCTKELRAKWIQCGHRPIGISYISQDIGNLLHELMVADALMIVGGNGISDKMHSHIQAAIAQEGLPCWVDMALGEAARMRRMRAVSPAEGLEEKSMRIGDKT